MADRAAHRAMRNTTMSAGAGHRAMRNTTMAAAAMLLLAATLPIAASEPPDPLLRPPIWFDADDKHVPEPADRHASELFGILYNSWFRHLDLHRVGLGITDRASLNVNAWDEVPDSSWFTNRIGLHPLAPEEVAAGSPGEAPQPERWSVRSVKTEGYTPGFQISDEAGRRYVLKFDIPDALERNSAAEIVGSRIMHAAGYWVPQYSIVYFRPEDLVRHEEAVREDLLGRERPMTDQDLAEAVALLVERPDGTVRGSASLFVPGVPIGPFTYWGTRSDDPNDIIPHELRRELRGLRVIASWFNHVDVKEANSLDAYVTEGDKSYVRHYYIDFGSSMGSGDFVNGPCRVGFENYYDGGAMTRSFFSLGIWNRPWEENCLILYPEVGRFDRELFDAARWDANYPNIAFQEADAADSYWGAKIVTAFTDENVRALAEAADYTRPAVTGYVEDALLTRRDRIGAHWFDVVTPLEEFEIDTANDPWVIRFRDLGVERGYAGGAGRSYTFEVKDARRFEVLEAGSSDTPGRIRIRSTPDVAPAATDRWGRTPVLVVEIRSRRVDGGPAELVRVIIGRQAGEPQLLVLGWAHAPRD